MEQHEKLDLARDAMSDGQVASKLWMIQNLESWFSHHTDRPPVITDPLRVWVLGGWHGILSLLLLTRNHSINDRLFVRSVRSFDHDPTCEVIADHMCQTWIVDSWRFKAHTKDCNNLDYESSEYGEPPNLVLNTAIEHFEDNEWWERIPTDTYVGLQSNNMPHKDHHNLVYSLDEFRQNYPMQEVLFAGSKKFNYPDKSFYRYMLIGRK